MIWDNLNTHLAKGMREFVGAHDWLTVYQLPPYSQDLNPVEGIWSLLRRKLANTAFTDPTTWSAPSAAACARSSTGPCGCRQWHPPKSAGCEFAAYASAPR